jgi:hypothetical protein
VILKQKYNLAIRIGCIYVLLPLTGIVLDVSKKLFSWHFCGIGKDYSNQATYFLPLI